MGKFEKRLWRSISRFVTADHKLRVQNFTRDGADLELCCVFCGHTLVVGSPGWINELAEVLAEAGCNVTKRNSPIASIRIH